MNDDESDYESVDRYEVLSGTAFVKKQYVRFARMKLQKVIKKKRIWVDPFNAKTFIYGMLEQYQIRIEEEEGVENLLAPIDLSIRGIV